VLHPLDFIRELRIGAAVGIDHRLPGVSGLPPARPGAGGEPVVDPVRDIEVSIIWPAEEALGGPGCPELALWTASMHRPRIVLTDSASISVVVKLTSVSVQFARSIQFAIQFALRELRRLPTPCAPT
jgi:hypothetical protein